MTFARIEKFLLFVTILFLPTQLGRHFWPQFSFVYSLPIDYLSPVFYFWDILVVLLSLIFILQARQINKPALNLFLLFILTQSLSILTNTANIGVGLTRLEQYFIAGMFGVYLSSCKFSRIKSVVFSALAGSVIAESLLAIIQFFKESTAGFWLFGERTFTISTPGIAKFDFYGREFLRPYATFPHPNMLAGFMLLAIFLLWFLKDKKIWLFIPIIFSTFVIMLTVSRVTIVVGVISALILTKNKYRLLILILIILLSPILYTRFLSLANYDNLTLVRREELSFVALKAWYSSPVFGVGLNNFIPNSADLLTSGPSRFLQPVHNIFLLAISETGIIGLIGLICLIAYPIFKLVKLYPLRLTLHPLLIIWIIIIFLGMFDHYFLTLPQGYRLLFLIWGLSFSWINSRLL